MHPRLFNSSLKNLETPHLYNFKTDEKYELDNESLEFLRRCTGRNSFEEIIGRTGSKKSDAKKLVKYLSVEGCIEDKKEDCAPEAFSLQKPILPSLRYLQLHITETCNLNCAHCYLGEK